MNRLKYLVLSLFLITLIGCSNDDSPVVQVSGTIQDANLLAMPNNCGWVINIEGTIYVPTYLNLQYEQHGLEVFMKVEFLDATADCGDGTLQSIRVEQMRLAN